MKHKVDAYHPVWTRHKVKQVLSVHTMSIWSREGCRAGMVSTRCVHRITVRGLSCAQSTWAVREGGLRAWKASHGNSWKLGNCVCTWCKWKQESSGKAQRLVERNIISLLVLWKMNWKESTCSGTVSEGSSSPGSSGDAFQDPRGCLKWGSTEPTYILCFSYTHMTMVKFNL